MFLKTHFAILVHCSSNCVAAEGQLAAPVKEVFWRVAGYELVAELKDLVKGRDSGQTQLEVP